MPPPPTHTQSFHFSNTLKNNIFHGIVCTCYVFRYVERTNADMRGIYSIVSRHQSWTAIFHMLQCHDLCGTENVQEQYNDNEVSQQSLWVILRFDAIY